MGIALTMLAMMVLKCKMILLLIAGSSKGHRNQFYIRFAGGKRQQRRKRNRLPVTYYHLIFFASAAIYFLIFSRSSVDKRFPKLGIPVGSSIPFKTIPSMMSNFSLVK